MFRVLCCFLPDFLSSAGDEGGEPSLSRMANARNVSFQSLHGGTIYLINLVDKSKVSLPHRRSTTVSLETNPLVCQVTVGCAIFLRLLTVEENELGFA